MLDLNLMYRTFIIKLSYKELRLKIKEELSQTINQATSLLRPDNEEKYFSVFSKNHASIKKMKSETKMLEKQDFVFGQDTDKKEIEGMDYLSPIKIPEKKTTKQSKDGESHDQKDMDDNLDPLDTIRSLVDQTPDSNFQPGSGRDGAQRLREEASRQQSDQYSDPSYYNKIHQDYKKRHGLQGDSSNKTTPPPKFKIEGFSDALKAAGFGSNNQSMNQSGIPSITNSKDESAYNSGEDPMKNPTNAGSQAQPTINPLLKNKKLLLAADEQHQQTPIAKSDNKAKSKAKASADTSEHSENTAEPAKRKTSSAFAKKGDGKTKGDRPVSMDDGSTQKLSEP